MTMPPRRSLQPEDLLSVKTITDVQASPDGSRVAYTLVEIDPDADEYRMHIWVVPVEGGEPVQFTRGPKCDTTARWSPDGTQLALLSDRDGNPPQLYVMPADGGEPRKLTSLDRGAGPATWSPGGTHLLFPAPVLKETPPADKDARARWEQRPRHVTRAQYKADGQGYTFQARSHLFVVSVREGHVRQITSDEVEDYAPAWSPDGRRITFSRTRTGAADYSLFDIWVGEIEPDRPALTNLRQITSSVGRATSPTWSPDGRTIACYGTDEQEPGLGNPHVRVWTVPAMGGAPRRLTADYDRSVFLLPPPAVTPGPVWSAEGGELTFTVSNAGSVHVVRASTHDGRLWPVLVGERQIVSSSAVPAVGRIAFCATEPHNPADIYVSGWDGSGERRLTRVNGVLLAGWDLPRVERRTFRGRNGVDIEGWLVRPLSGKVPAPLLVHFHGGPASFVGNAFPHSAFYWYALAGQGWAVLALNPSGSGSYGKAFAYSLRGRWGEYDLPEQLAALDDLVAEGIADPQRLAVTGYSYGGYMTSWTITHSDRFKAAVIGAPVTNLESFYGTSDIGMWFGAWEMDGDLPANRETFRHLSPINYVERATTPALILHGEADDRCPIGQGEEFFIGLVAAGKVSTEFVRYPGGSHLFLLNGRPSHRVNYARRVVEWVERYTTEDGRAAVIHPPSHEGVPYALPVHPHRNPRPGRPDPAEPAQGA